MAEVKETTELWTPLGIVNVELDGTPIPFILTQLEPLEYTSPDIAGRYRIDVGFIPDGKEHFLSCSLHPNQPVSGGSESGENLECGGYYNKDESIKVSIGLHADGGYYWKNGKQIRNESFDYDAEIVQRGSVFHNEYITLPSTKTSHYVFGVCWILDCDNEREVQTWYGADPWIMLQDNPIETCYGWYLEKTVTIETKSGKSFSGDVCGFGCSIDGKEKYEREEPYIEVYDGDCITVLFEQEICRIVETPAAVSENEGLLSEASAMDSFWYCGIEFEDLQTVYSYISDLGEIPIGTYVEVPLGYKNTIRIGIVRYCGLFSEQDVPYPIEKTKHILRIVPFDEHKEQAVFPPKKDTTRERPTMSYPRSSAPWIHFNLGFTDMHLRISDYSNDDNENYDDRWCCVDLTVEGGTGVLNYAISSDIMLSGEVDTLEYLIENLLNGQMTEPQTMELLEPNLRFAFLPEYAEMDFQIILWDDAPSESYISLRFYGEYLQSFLTYLQLITRKLSMSSPQVQKSIEADILRP